MKSSQNFSETVLDLLKNSFLTHPTKTALIFRNKELNYENLHLKSNKLSNYLNQKGNYLNKPISFCLEQSLERVITMIAIWKSGGAYVSLDPLYPDSRLQLMIEDTSSQVLITTKALAGKFRFFKGWLVIIDDIAVEKAIESTSDQDNPVKDLDKGLAYLAYTSGSTGIPKAVMAEHRGLANFIKSYQTFLQANEDDSALQISGSNFDGIGLDLWAPLASGIKVHLYPDHRIVGEPLLDFIAEKEITILPYLPVSILATLPTDERIGSLRKIFTGGEAPTPHVIGYWKTKVDLINMYGPTETTIVVSVFRFADSHPVATFGKPFPNVGYYLLDDNLQQVTPRQAGQLFIGGIQVSQGYLNRPELTAERFINHTLPGGKTIRLYRTGDIAQQLEDGNYVFVGRADLQVKIRGFRVELNEIDEVLRKSGLINNCAVIVKGEEDKKLICYYAAEADPGSELLRTYLLNTLPSYMVPSAFIHLNDFPLTDNGKIDRTKLATLEINENHALRNSYIPPETELEEQLAEIWATTLGTQKLGIDDNFFHFGGNSILAYKLVSAIRNHLNLPVQIADLFFYPTIRDFALNLEKQETEQEQLAMIEPDITQEKVGLSVQQQSLWFLDKLNGSLPYHIGVSYPLESAVSPRALEKAFRMLLDRHTVLRTVIKEEDNQPYQSLINSAQWRLQQIHNPVSLNPFMDISFDLRRDYMIRAYLINNTDKPTSLYLIIHHIATDGWSMPLLIKELNELYQHVAHQKKPILSIQPVQYRDYAHWQQNNISRPKLDAGLSFWKQYLADVPVLQLAHDFSRPEFQRNTGKQHHFLIDPQLSSALKKLSENEHVTLYMTLLSAFGLLMQHHSGQHDICIGTPAANRSPSNVDATIGYFINMIPIRIQIEDNPVYKDFLQSIRQMLPAVFKHQEIPLESIAKHVVNDRLAGYNPLFQTVFILQEALDTDTDSTPIINHQLEWIYNGKSKFDLQFEVTPTENGLQVVIEYADALFSEPTISLMAGNYERLLKAIATSPVKRIGDFEISPVPAAFSEAQPITKIEKTLVGLFEEQVKLRPDKVALSLSGMHLSYRQLNIQSNYIADYLIKLGVKKGQFVACLLDQSIERISVLLGILKSGAAYVPIDTSYPVERTNAILEDATPSFLITTERHRSIAGQLNVDTLYLEAFLNLPVSAAVRKTYTDTHSPSDLVYVIYTSGTTGNPKGVLIEHRSVSNFVTQYGDLLEIGEYDRSLQFSPYNFDGSVMDIWIPLTRGATIHLYPNNKLLGETLSDFITLHAITVLPFISPTVLSTISQTQKFPALRVIATGAESCPASLSRYWMKQLKLINAYGPTEATVAVNKFVYDDQHPGNTLGVAIENTRLYVLDKFLRPVPAGVIGDLYISGVQLSRGYLNQPELTAQRFIPNHFIKSGDLETNIYNQLYKTGDQVRISAEGLLEYIGRADHQIKIRGYRVELSEIENTLHEIDGVDQAIVQIVSSESNVIAIRAFVSGEIQKSAIRTQLSKKLPSYMIPSEIIAIDTIPVKSNGKMDTAALLLLAEQNLEEPEADEIPANGYEEILKNVWIDVLQRKNIGLEDDFFHIGGHSLLLVKLYSRISEHYPGKISLSELYVNNTIRKLALLIEERETSTFTGHYSLGNDPLSDEIRKDAEMEIEGLSDIADLKVKGNFSNPEAILVTGVTGFVGVAMLEEFIRSTSAVIYLLIRSDNEAHAEARLLETMKQQLIPLEVYQKDRIKLLSGDLSKPYLGLKKETYDELSSVIDVIHHAGSAVNFIQPYSYMKAANVDGLLMLIKFAVSNKLKHINLLSTVGVFSWEHYFTKPGIMMEDDSIEPAFKYLSRDMGYIQSKWVMEKMATKAIEKGVPITIFRLGYAFCNGLTGATARYQWWGLLVKACIDLKTVPILEQQKEEFVTVDFISKSIAHISKNPAATGKIFHLSPTPEDNITVSDFFDMMKAEFGIEAKAVPYKEWVKLWENDENNPLYPLLSLFKFKVYDDKAIIEIHQNTPDFDVTNTVKFLEGSGIETPKIDRGMLERFCRYLGVLE